MRSDPQQLGLQRGGQLVQSVQRSLRLRAREELADLAQLRLPSRHLLGRAALLELEILKVLERPLGLLPLPQRAESARSRVPVLRSRRGRGLRQVECTEGAGQALGVGLGDGELHEGKCKIELGGRLRPQAPRSAFEQRCCGLVTPLPGLESPRLVEQRRVPSREGDRP